MTKSTVRRIMLIVLLGGLLWAGYCAYRGIDAYRAVTVNTSPPPEGGLISPEAGAAFSDSLGQFALQLWLWQGSPGLAAAVVAGLAVILIGRIRLPEARNE